jgi:CheY-like chemotaxis protein
MLQDAPPESFHAASTKVIRQAAKRAATLTRQLLAYGRRQFLRPEKLNLNEIVKGMEDIVRHLVGSNVDVSVVSANNVYDVFADAGQIEEVITNVILNAQDAMPNGGKLTLETANIAFDPESAGRYPEVKPGNYAMLSITDTGKGMTPEIKARMFEPFFSTKEVGKGTGLGLATAYGIIKQSGGHILVYSEPGQGTTFRIYLPQMEEKSQTRVQSGPAPNPPKGSESILVVEDDPALLEMNTKYLERLGYRVFSASDGVEAMKILETPGREPIHLLFTDIVMPKMDGVKLSERVAQSYPAIKILFTSAYAEHALIHQGIVTPGMTLLEKPFGLSILARKVRDALDANA